MVLYKGSLGKLFGGRWSGLEFTPPVTSFPFNVLPLTSEAVCATSVKDTVQEYIYITPAKTEHTILEFSQKKSIGG